jgi:glycosyltransferase involved in cell wall biosynthesis
MQILLVSDLGPPYIGGGERYLLELSTRLASLGHEVHWCFSQLPGTKKEELYQGVHIHRISIPFSQHFLFPGRQFFPFRLFYLF